VYLGIGLLLSQSNYLRRLNGYGIILGYALWLLSSSCEKMFKRFVVVVVVVASSALWDR
jgi:hypothetical protein